MGPASECSEASLQTPVSEAPVMRRPGRHRIYINVGYVLTEEHLRNYFGKFGTVLDVYLPKHKSNRNKGFGFCTFDTEEELERVLRTAEHVINGSVVKINRAGPRPEYGPGLPDETANKSKPAEMLPMVAPAESGHWVVPETPHWTQPENTHWTSPLTAEVNPDMPSQSPTSQPAVQHGRGPRLYVGGIHNDITEDDVKEHFSRWGRVLDVYFPARTDAGKKGARRVNYCFVTFENWRSAQQACNESERSINGRPLQSISVAEDRTKVEQQRAEAIAAAAGASPGLPDIAAFHHAMQNSDVPPMPASIPALNFGAAQGLQRPYPQNLLQALQQAQLNLSGNPSLQGAQFQPPAPPPPALNVATLRLLSQTPLRQMLLQQLLAGNITEPHTPAPPPPPSGLSLGDLTALLQGSYGSATLQHAAQAAQPPLAPPVTPYGTPWAPNPPPMADTLPGQSPQLAGLAGLLDPATLNQLANQLGLANRAQTPQRVPPAYSGFVPGAQPPTTPRTPPEMASSLLPPGLLAQRIAQMGGTPVADTSRETSPRMNLNSMLDPGAQTTQGWSGLDYASLLGQSESARGSRRASPDFSEPRERYGGLSIPSTPSMTPVTTPNGPNPLRHMFNRDGMSTGPSSPHMLGEGVNTSGWPDVQVEQGADRLSSADLLDAAAGYSAQYGPQRNWTGRGAQGRGYPY